MLRCYQISRQSTAPGSGEALNKCLNKVKALTTALGDGQAIRYVIEALEGYGKDAAATPPLLKKLKLSPDDTIRKAALKAIEKIE